MAGHFTLLTQKNGHIWKAASQLIGHADGGRDERKRNRIYVVLER